MEYSLPNNVNFTEGPEQLLLFVTDQIPQFIPTLLFSFFLIVFLGGMFSQQRLSGKGDVVQWFAIAGITNVVLATVLNLISGVVALEVLVVSYGVAMIAGVVFLVSRGE